MDDPSSALRRDYRCRWGERRGWQHGSAAGAL